MKLLMIYADYFGYKTAVKALEDAPDIENTAGEENALVGFIHVEPEDVDKLSKVVTKLIKNLKWLAGKNNTRKIILHSFSHLSENKAAPGVVLDIFNQAEKRLTDSGYKVVQTPFGYFLDLDLKAPGTPLARVFKSF